MDNTQLGYMKFTRRFMCIVGQWPHQGTLERILVSLVYLPFVGAQAVLQGGGMIAAWNYDSDIALENFAPFLVSLMIVVKIVNFIFNSSKMKKLLVTMQDDWGMVMKRDEEIRILQDYYSVGTLLSKGYAVCVYGSMAPFLTVPVITLTTRFLGMADNDTEKYPLIFHAEYFINVEKYYYFALIHSYFGTIGFCAAVVGIDSMFVFYVQHACGIITILGHRLENFIKDGDIDIDIYPKKMNDKACKLVGECVALHNHILRYSQLLESANTVSFFLQLGLNMVCISFTGFQAVMHLDKPDEAFRYGSFAIAQTCHLLYESLPAQQLYDHSIRVCEFAGSGNWYRASLRTRKILNLMILRSQTPIQLTAGKFYTLNLENFSAVIITCKLVLSSLKNSFVVQIGQNHDNNSNRNGNWKLFILPQLLVVRTSFSYFTVLCSMR